MGESSVNILYDHALDWIEDTPELAQKLIIPQTQSHRYRFDRNKAHSHGTVEFPVRTNPLIVIMEFNILDVPSPYNDNLGRPWIHMMRAIPSTYHQLLRYPTPFEMANIRGDKR